MQRPLRSYVLSPSLCDVEAQLAGNKVCWAVIRQRELTVKQQQKTRVLLAQSQQNLLCGSRSGDTGPQTFFSFSTPQLIPGPLSTRQHVTTWYNSSSENVDSSNEYSVIVLQNSRVPSAPSLHINFAGTLLTPTQHINTEQEVERGQAHQARQARTSPLAKRTFCR